MLVSLVQVGNSKGIRIPKSILISNGGTFGTDDVEQKVKKHMALGEYPILEYV